MAIEAGAFSGCDGLVDVYYAGTESDRENEMYIFDDFDGNDSLVNAIWHYETTGSAQN